MNILDFLAALRARDIQISADGDRLRCNAPAGAMTPKLRDELQLRKTEILKFLSSAKSLDGLQPGIVPLQPQGTEPPIFAVAGHNGDVFCFRALAQHLGNDQPFFGLQPPGLEGSREPISRVEELAAYFAAQIRAVKPTGPYVISGYCAGGTIAYELAHQLLRGGAEIRLLALFGSPFPTAYRFLPQLRLRFAQLLVRAARHIRATTLLPMAGRRDYIAERLRNLKSERAAQGRAAQDPVLVWRDKVGRATLAAIRRYTPGAFNGRLRLFWPCKEKGGEALAQWQAVAQDTRTFFGPADCDGAGMLREPYAATFAEVLTNSIQEVDDRKAAIHRTFPAVSPRWETGQTEAMPL
jgi:thioesterase domain-containing protein